MQCEYFDAGVCRSCTLMGQGYAVQLSDKQAMVATVLAAHVPPAAWCAPVASSESGFRNKAKLVVGGRRGAPTLGILDASGRGVDLRRCGVHEPGLRTAVAGLAGLIADVGLTPYDVPSRQGELKHVLLTHSPDSELMARFVLRSPGQRRRVVEIVDRLRSELVGTRLRVASLNLQPEHKAVLEGSEEELLTQESTVPMRVDGLTLHLGTGSFFQTNTAVAGRLYRQVADWVEAAAPDRVWDLYCGVGGFALHAAGQARSVIGVEVSQEAIHSARRSAAEAGLTRTAFVSQDATRYAVTAPRDARPDLLVVNPPRRGLGTELAHWIEASGIPSVICSSCSASSLADDLTRMPSYAVRQARMFDMFPQTRHHEVAVLLQRT